jgi:hypothetical protein
MGSLGRVEDRTQPSSGDGLGRDVLRNRREGSRANHDSTLLDLGRVFSDSLVLKCYTYLKHNSGTPNYAPIRL